MKIKHTLMLFTAAVIWGVAFVAQSVGMDYVGPYTMICVRSLLASAVLVPYMILRRGKTPDPPEAPADAGARRALLWKVGIACGVLLCAATCLQQLGILYSTVGKAGFITSFYIVLVPVAGLLLGRRASKMIWAAVALAMIGLYFLCVTGRFSLERGDIYLLLCALVFAAHILTIDRFTRRVDGAKMSAIQFLVAGVLSAVPMLILEKPNLSQILAAWLPIVYAGALSGGVAYTLQIVGQREVDPAVASIIFSLEAVVSAVAGFLILGQRLSARELLGCGLMFAATLLAQLPGRSPRLADRRKKPDRTAA
jgi:drug/metabolite transporter (DMT)-like permease